MLSVPAKQQHQGWQQPWEHTSLKSTGGFACALHCCQLSPHQVYASVLAGCLKNPQLPRVFSEASFSNVFLNCGPLWHALSCPR